jgi:hypothetical protein
MSYAAKPTITATNIPPVHRTPARDVLRVAAVLPKPFERERLVAVVERLLAAAR